MRAWGMRHLRAVCLLVVCVLRVSAKSGGLDAGATFDAPACAAPRTYRLMFLDIITATVCGRMSVLIIGD